MGSVQKFYADAAVERARKKRVDLAEPERWRVLAHRSKGSWEDELETEIWAQDNAKWRKRG